MVALGPVAPAPLPPTAAVLPRCGCGETGAQTVPGEWLCEAGHLFYESESHRIVRELAEVGFPVLLDPGLLREGAR